MENKRVVIIGAVALGPKTACRLKRLMPGAEVVMVDQDEYISYGGCGIPYYISGDVSDVKELMATSFHMLRTPQFFEEAKGVHVRSRTQALSIDRRGKKVLVRDLATGKEEELPYDQLVIATGSRPNRLPIPGMDLPRVYSVTNLHSAIAVKDRIAKGEVSKALIIGAGPIGCEMAEALSDLWGLETTVVEIAGQVLPGILDHNMALMVQKQIEDRGVTLHLNESVQEIQPMEGGESALKVRTSQRNLDADLVITAVGVQPNSELAKAAGLNVSPRGAIVVNRRLQTSDPDIYAGGDCIEVPNLITGKSMHFPQGSLANRQGRVIGTNIFGGFATFNGVVGSFTVKVFDMAVAAAGLCLQAAKREGYDAASALVIQADRAHFYPTQSLMHLQLVVDRKTRRVLGIQGVGENGDALVGRINAVAALLPYRPGLDDISNMEVAYSPPYASAMDIMNALGNTAENVLDGLNKPMGLEEFEECFLKEEGDDVVCLDVRGPANAAPFVERYGDRWVNIPQETLHRRFDEVPKDKKVILVCNSGARSYEALRQLEAQGFEGVKNLEGGVAAVKKAGIINMDDGEASEKGKGGE